MELPWTEKYRPANLSEIMGQDEIVERLKAYTKDKSMPHLLFSGPAGTGKTTAAIAIARELFGDISHDWLELNASDERGIDVVRVKIKNFARTRPINGDFKIIFLDEADALTSDAQNALRRTMENYTQTCRFILSCVSPDTKIVLPGEVEVTMSEFEGEFDKGVISVNGKELEDDSVLCYMKIDPMVIGKKTLRISTMSGRHLDVTEDHPILTDRGWINAGELDLGDKAAVFPYLEGTEPVREDGLILDETHIKEFMHESNSHDSQRYRGLSQIEKERIHKRVVELNKAIEANLTPQEKKIYDIVDEVKLISREELSKKVNLSRPGTNYHLKSLVKKGWFERIIDGENPKTHKFKIKKSDPLQIRNKMDIKRRVEKEFEIKISYKTVCNIIEGKENKRYLKGYALCELGTRGLMPLTYKNGNIGIISRLSGFLLGDGHITRNNQRLIFTTDKESLKEIQDDLIKLGYTPSDIFSKKLENNIRGRVFTGRTTWMHLDSRPLALLFRCLGIPNGDKCIQEFYVPDWIMNGPKFVKREFMRGIFGSEMYSPKCNARNFEAFMFRQHKALRLSKSGEKFMRQLMSILLEFGVESKFIKRKLGYKRKSGDEMCMVGLQFASNENIFNYLSRVGYAYSCEKERKGRLASEYLRHKLCEIEKRKEKAREVLVLSNSCSDLSARWIARVCDCSPDFVFDRRKGKEVHLSRDFPTFSEWEEKYGLPKSKLLWNTVEKIEDIKLGDVRDILCPTNHNFIANGIVSHNCNYSSKIIEPIQSRCSIFRFKRLTKEAIAARLKDILGKEGVKFTEGGIDAILYVAEGDMRHAVNILQSAATMGDIDEKNVYSIASRARPEEVKNLITLALSGKFLDARNLLDKLLVSHGLSGEDILIQMNREVFNMEVGEKTKVRIIDLVGEANFTLVEGANERIQLEALLARIMSLK